MPDRDQLAMLLLLLRGRLFLLLTDSFHTPFDDCTPLVMVDAGSLFSDVVEVFNPGKT